MTARCRTRSSAALALALLAPVGPALAQAAGAVAPGTTPQHVTVDEITVTGNTLLPEAQLAAALAPFKGLRTVDELQQAAQAVQALYRQAGWGAVVAYLPEQPLGGGRLVIAVLEGRVARVTVVGNRRFDTANVRRSVPALQEGQTPPVQRIDQQVTLANENPARKLALTLEAGQQSGDIDARVNVEEDETSRWTASLDNSGNPQTGRLRVGLSYQNAALFDRDQQLAVQAQVAPEHPSRVRIGSASWRAPWYDAGLLFGVYGTWSTADAGTSSTAAGALQFNGQGRVLGVSVMRVLPRLSLPGFGEFDQRLTLSLDGRQYRNNCTIQGLPAGACGSAGESVAVHPLTLDYSAQRGGDRPFGFDLSAARNLAFGGKYGGADDFEAVRAGAKRGYTLARLAAFGALPFDGDWRLSGRLSAQATGDALVPGEQFGVSGAAQVRGYEEREITGDSGFAASLELVTPRLLDDRLRLLAFVDAGQARNHAGAFCNNDQQRCTLAAAGIGSRFKVGRSQWRLDVAQALKDGRTTRRNDTRVHLQVSVDLP